MAKSSKLEDYWRQHNIEGLFKELTHMLVQRMPSDPANALVQLLQKKFPKSFKTSIDTTTTMDSFSKTMTNNLQLQSMTSPRTDFNLENTNDVDMQRRLSNQSQASNIINIPTLGSAFTDLLKQDTSNSKQAPELSLKNLVFANRLTQQVFKMGKDVRSDRDILEEELIKPLRTKTNVSSAADASAYSLSGDLQHAETHEQPSVKQLVKYKQNIHTENKRRQHQEKLANLAKEANNKEHMLLSDLPTQSIEGQQQQTSDGDGILSQVTPNSKKTKVPYQPVAKSKEEEEILNDENVFHPRTQRQRERQRNKPSTSPSNTPHIGGRDRGLSMRKEHANGVPMMQFCICKVCKNVVTNDDNQVVSTSQQVSAAPTARSFEPQQSNRSVETASGVVDDWFESASDVSGPRQVLPWTPDDAPLSSTTSNIFQRTIFQPIKDYDTVNTKYRSPTIPLIIADDESFANRSTVSRSPASDVFVRTPEPKIRRSSSSRSNPSPVTKKHQTDTLTTLNQQLFKNMAHPSDLRLVPESTLTTTKSPTTERRMSEWSVREQSPDGSDEN